MSTMTGVQTKRCVKCGADVTGAQRMKDSKGQYWCMDCGGKDAATKSASLISPCPRCHKPTHAHNLVRHNGTYVCEQCAGGGKPGGKGTAESASRTKMAVGVGIAALAGVAYYVMNFVLV